MVNHRLILAGLVLLGACLLASQAAAQCTGTPNGNLFCASPDNAAGLPTFRTFVPRDFNSGTGASSTTFWRGDGTWATPAGGGGGTPGGISGQIQFNNSGAFGGFTMSQDCTITTAGVITCTKTNNVAFAASATTDTTNASNISAGTLAAARGGAGTITGALKGSGAGVVSQAACADLSNGASGCSTAVGTSATVNTGTSGATIPLNNGGFTQSGTANFTSTFQISGNAMTFPAAAATLTQTVASGSLALSTTAIASAACSAAQTATATGTLTTDVVLASFNGDPTAVTGYVPLTTGMLTIIPYPTANTINFKVCNNSSASITPGAITLNWRVTR